MKEENVLADIAFCAFGAHVDRAGVAYLAPGKCFSDLLPVERDAWRRAACAVVEAYSGSLK